MRAYFCAYNTRSSTHIATEFGSDGGPEKAKAKAVKNIVYDSQNQKLKISKPARWTGEQRLQLGRHRKTIKLFAQKDNMFGTISNACMKYELSTNC